MSFMLTPQWSFAEESRCEASIAEAPAAPDVVLSYSTEFNHTYQRAFRAEYKNVDGWFRRASMIAMRARIKRKIKEACAASSGCTADNIERLVAHEVEKSVEKADRAVHGIRVARGYAILAGLTAGWAAGAFFMRANLHGDLQFVSEVIPVITTLVVINLGAPLFDQVRAIVARGSYRLREGKDFFRKSTDRRKQAVMQKLAHYYAMSRVLNEKMTPIEQAEGSRINGMLSSVEQVFANAIESTQSADASKGGIQRGSTRIALMAIKLRQFFPEVSFDDPDLLRSIHMTYTQYLPDPLVREQAYMIALDQIQKNEPQFMISDEERHVYVDGLRHWFDLP